MKRILTFLGAAVMSCALLVACEKEDSTTGPGIDDDGPSGTPDALVLARNFPPILANGMDEIEVTATVVDSRGRAVENVGVLFTTTHGTIEPYATTGNNGVATTTLTSVASATDVNATITAVASTTAPEGLAPQGTPSLPIPLDAVVIVSRTELSESAIGEALKLHEERIIELGRDGVVPNGENDQVIDQIQIRMKGLTVSLVANPSTIPADGISTSQVTANVSETTSHIPLSGQSVQFGATAGNITGTVTTDASGNATATLTGLTSGTNSQVTAFYGPTLKAETTVAFSALSLAVTPERTSLTADGASTINVVARLLNAERNPVRNATVTFTTTAGVVSSPEVTDENGEAVATLRAAGQPGIATVRASFGSATQTADVIFTAAPVATSILLDFDPSTLPANGSAQSTVTARVLDGGGNLMPNGSPVTFFVVSGGGTIVGPSQLVQNGEAKTTYVAGTTPGPVVIRASSGAATREAQLTLAPLGAGGVSLTAGSANVLADGLASTILTATVTDDFGNPVAEGTPVSFQTSRGSVEGVTPTNAEGIATARLRANRYETGMARVTASVGQVTRTVDVSFVSEAASHIETIELNRPSIGVQGSGSAQTATVILEVQDRFGIPVDAAHQATVALSVVPVGGTTDATISPASASTNEKGRVAATVRAGTISGTVEVFAQIGAIQSEPIRVAIHGDQPDPAHFSIAFERVNIAGRIYSGLLDPVTAYVGDHHGNPVPDSTVVWFRTGDPELSYGLIQGSQYTDDHGRATVNHITADPRPDTDGIVTITAQTVAKGGGYIETSGQILWSGPTELRIIDPQTFDVPNGGSVVIHFEIVDDLGNPITGGSTITATTTVGNLGGHDQFTIPDTIGTGEGLTEFTVILSDEDVDEIDPRSVTVTISVTSVNGNRETSITGTLH